MTMKRILAILLSAMFIFVMLAACGGNTDTDPAPGGSTTDGNGEAPADEGPPTFNRPEYDLVDKEADVIRYTADGRRHIRIGTFYDMFYDSTHADIYDGTDPTDPIRAQMVWDNVKRIEEKYNVYIEYVNLGWDGIVENIPISIMAGWPDCDAYLCDMQFGVPAVLNNMATAIEDMDVNPEFLADLFGEKVVAESLQIPGMDKTYLFRDSALVWHMYLLGYNKTMIEEKGLEDPRELWYAGQWTWDKFMEHLIALTDASQNIYGFRGFWTTFLEVMLFSNDTNVAAGPIQTLDDPKTVEVLNFIHEMYNVRKVAAPWDNTDWDSNQLPYREGLAGFWMTAPWINQQFLDAVGRENPLPFEVGMVPAPVGPQGNADTMAMKNASSGNFYIIPRYIKDPGEVFNVMYELFNWFDGDVSERDDMESYANEFVTEENLNIYLEYCNRNGFELFPVLPGTGFSIPRMIETTESGPEFTPAEFVETFRQVLQDALDSYFG